MKIVILGGGTAGWIAALAIAKAQPNVHDITVIESKKIGIIGAGEGSTGIFVDFLSGKFFNIGIDISDFIEKTNTTLKFGLKLLLRTVSVASANGKSPIAFSLSLSSNVWRSEKLSGTPRPRIQLWRII